MAVMTEFLDLIVPISVIEEKYPGGWEQCLIDHRPAIGGRVWYDAHLFRDGAMSPEAMEHLLKEWTKLGFECSVERNGQRYWKDVCVFEGSTGGPTLPCEWLSVDYDTRSVYLRGTAPGELMGRDWDLSDHWEPPDFPGL